MIRVLFLFALPLFLCSQAELRIGEWQNQIPYNNGIKITQSDQFIYYATDLAILQINKLDLSTKKISTIEGLSGSRINAIYFHKSTKILIIAYSDGLIDLVKENGTSSVPFIKIYNNIPISKNINSIDFKDDQSVFVSADFGFISLNLLTEQVEFTVFTTNLKVNNITVFQNNYFAATAKGLFFFDPSFGNLVEDFSNWNLLDLTYGLDPSINYKQVLVFNNSLFSLGINKLYKFSNNYFDEVRIFPDFGFINASGEGTDLILNMKYDFNNERKLFILKNGSDWLDLAGDCVIENIQTIQENSGRVWLADARNGFRYMDDYSGNCNLIKIGGPYSNNVFQIKTLSDGIYVASGGWDETFTYLYRKDGIFTYKNKTWDYINAENNNFFKNNNILDILGIVENKDLSKIYFSSYQQGLIEFDRASSTYKIYNSSNTSGTLGTAVGDPGRVRLTGLDYDNKNDKLWICNYLASNPIVSLDKNGKWQSYSLPISSQILSVTVDHNGYKWLVFRDGLGVFDDRNTETIADDRFVILNSSNTNLTSNIIYNVTVDLEGDVWVGTGSGPVIFECGSSIFDGTCKGTRRKVDQNGIIGYLLETEEILSIAVDGANRKWIGTRRGLYVQSPSGEIQVEYFNTSNSPLLSNNIFSLAINQITGEIWIGTDRGIQVYRSTATGANDNFVTVPTVYPNPVTKDYTGLVAIKGLARDARVKITDLSGRLVFETFANGGQAVWDRKDYLGNEVSSGIYLIFANTVKDFDKSEGLVTKLILSR